MLHLLYYQIKEEIDKKGFTTFTDPCCGAGVMLIAFANVLLKYGFNPQKVLWFELRDIDINCCYMAYIQSSLLGLSGTVEHGNTITIEIWDRFITPFSMFNYHKFRSFAENSAEEKQIINTEIQTQEREKQNGTINIQQLKLFA